MVYVVDILNLVTIVASMIFFMLYRRYQHEVYTIADISNRSQIDYSIFVENIPIFLPTEDSQERQSIGLECKYENELKELLE
jgi:arginyl-tRNA--protein-N-Asp/Glu arginylyltransferase